MSSISRNVYIDKLVDIANKYSNTYHSTIRMKPVDVKANIYFDSTKEINNKHPKFNIGDTVKILKYKDVLAKGYTASWSEEFLWLKKLKILCRGHISLISLMEKKLLEIFTRIAKNKSRRFWNWKSNLGKRW